MTRSNLRHLLPCALAVALLLATPLAGAAGLGVDTGVGAAAPNAASDLFVVPLEESLLSGGDATAEVQILLDGRPVLEESFGVRLNRVQGDAGIEILAAEPVARSLYRELAERGDARVEARLILDGREAARLDVADLVSAASRVAENELRLLPLSFQAPGTDSREAGIRSITARDLDCSARDACLTQCSQDYTACANALCGGPTRLCEECLDQYTACRLNCPPCECVDPKSVTYETTTQLVSTTFLSTGCYEDPYDPFSQYGVWWDQYQYTYKKTEYKHTEMCDGTVTTQVVSIWYEYASCWSPTFFTCSFPQFYTPYPQCY